MSLLENMFLLYLLGRGHDLQADPSGGGEGGVRGRGPDAHRQRGVQERHQATVRRRREDGSGRRLQAEENTLALHEEVPFKKTLV